MSRILPKVYEPQKYEDQIYESWEESGLFNPDVGVERGITKPDAAPFSMVLPPPNVTGTLHMGHAVMLAVQDVMARYHRMRGDKTLWIPGTDHAAIATQSKVETILFEEEGKTRHDLGREEFLRKVDAYAQSSHDTIVNQSRKMGASLDWSREAFTLDQERNLAVRTAFKRMYDDGLIYRGHRIVSWDPVMQCNVSDVEIEYREEESSFYYFQYGPFVIGTARPETKFSDKYVLIHPNDERYQGFEHGETLTCEWINGPITATVIKDEAVDPNFGTGAMTITPWHSAIDFDLAEKHGLPKEQIIDLYGKLLPVAGEFAGMTIAEARPKIVAKLHQKGLVVKIDEHYKHHVATNYRGGGVLEPQIREQWFLDVNKSFKFQNSRVDGIDSGDQITLKQLAQQVVRSGQITIIPNRFQKFYFDWVDNLRDWCLSRQIWYGHQIPVWYCENSVCPMTTNFTPIVSVQDILACPTCGGSIRQDSDTLDTWFSAGLWTFSTLGWPKDTSDLTIYHPTAVLETGYDILTFWVIRMVLMTTYCLGQIPFHTVYLHGLVQDEQGRKMSKTLNNILDPLEMTGRYGTDATRLSLLIGATPGNDTKLSEAKIAGFRNFTNKLWNIARFILGKTNNTQITIQKEKGPDNPEPKTLADRWMLSRLHKVIGEVTEDIEQYRFSLAGEKLRDFTWSELADWYLEVAKIEGEKSEMLSYILRTILKLWHPYMPFVTEAIWSLVMEHEKSNKTQSFLMVEAWPRGGEIDEAAMTEFEIIKAMVTGVRSLRASFGVAPTKRLRVILRSSGSRRLFLEGNIALFKDLARLESVDLASKTETEGEGKMSVFVVGDIEVFVDLAGAIDVAKEKERIQKEIDRVMPFVTTLENKLNNTSFVENAPEYLVRQERERLAETKNKLENLKKQFSFFS